MYQLHSYLSRKLLPAFLVGLFLCLSIGTQVSHAQADDPLNKPSIWAALVDNPQNNGLWSKYFGKDLFDLTKEEGVNFKTWRSELIAAQNAPVTVRRSPIEDDALNRLTNNISKNFVLIEDYFNSEFKKMGVEYVSYGEKYPDQSFNKIVWVEEHEKKLKELWHAP